MRLGLQVNMFDYPGGDSEIGPTFARIAREAEAAGMASLWVMDHFFQIPPNGAAEEPMLEAYTALGYAAAMTETIKLGTMVASVTYRQPAVLIKAVTTLDVLSSGRAYLGIGAGWFEREHVGLGIPFPPLKDRFEQLEETLQIAQQMWSGTVGPYQGKHYQLAETLCRPMPLSRPHPPILIGGSGERKTLRFVARYGDACNIRGEDPAVVQHKLDVLRGHCEAESRSYDEIQKTTLRAFPRVTRGGGGGTVSPAEAIEILGRLAELGVDEHILGWHSVGDLDGLELFANQIVPQVATMTVAGR
ncbi:MAG TPA: LLM class F420-dependent oxidoreductase [Thermomicrobiales bacterium]|nr:LLM class F420-dependent oxidoreductase [Thermomicrobiales bacterium]